MSIVITVFGASVAFLLFLRSLISAFRLQDFIIGAFFLSNAVILAYFAVSASRLLLTYPHLFMLEYPASLVGGPLFFFYLSMLMNPNFKIGRARLIHFLPALLTIVMFSPMYFSEASVKLALIEKMYLYWRLNKIDYVLGFLNGGCFILYLLLTGQQYYFMIKEKRKSSMQVSFRALNVVLFFYLVAIGASIFIIPFLGEDMLALVGALITLIMITLYFLGQIRSNILQTINEKFSSVRNQRDYISHLDVGKVVQQLETKMQSEKLFCQPNLSIAHLAEKLELTTHQLSQILNQQLKKKFSEYINDLRINEAIQIIEKNSDLPIYAVAMQVGFGSRVTFAQCFRKKTGFSPSEYRNKTLS